MHMIRNNVCGFNVSQHHNMLQSKPHTIRCIRLFNWVIFDFIDLSASLLADNNSFNDQDFDEESIIIDHGNPNFDIDELINSFENI